MESQICYYYHIDANRSHDVGYTVYLPTFYVFIYRTITITPKSIEGPPKY
jgi:intergrase/recombinase